MPDKGAGCHARSLTYLPVQIRAFYIFHVYVTVRRILYQLGGIQNISAWPGDPTFNQFNNHYDVPSYKRLCNVLGIHPSSDFRFKKVDNNGLGNIYLYGRGTPDVRLEADYPGSIHSQMKVGVDSKET